MRQWVLGEFASGKALLAAVRTLREEGFRRVDLYTPYPVKGSEDALGLPPTRIPWIALAGALLGAGGAYLIMWFCNAVDYPLNVGNRPLNSVPTDIPIMFESAVLASAVGIFLGLLALFRFPRLHHPVFELEAFRSASHDGYWVSITFDEAPEAMERALARVRELGARTASVVAEEPELGV